MWMDVTVKGLVWCPFQGLSIVPADAIVVRQDKALNKTKKKRKGPKQKKEKKDKLY